MTMTFMPDAADVVSVAENENGPPPVPADADELSIPPLHATSTLTRANDERTLRFTSASWR
jgi:hypothetical protein